MSRRRAFDVEAPAAEPDAATPPPARRGPMAAAVRETAASLSDRAAREAAIRAENDALAAAHVAAKRAGLLLEAVDPDAIDEGWLIRDRAPVRDEDIEALKASIREIGLSNPIRLARIGDGQGAAPGPRRFALVQGWRRLAAWRELRAEGPGFERIPAAIGPADREDAAALASAYRRMVDENLMRRDVSFAEMARLARAYADAHLGGDADAAVAELFRSAAPQKRSYIRNFVEVMDAVGDALAHPAALPRAVGVALRNRMREAPETAEAVRIALAAQPDRSETLEVALLRAVADPALPLPTAERPDPLSALLRGALLAGAQTEAGRDDALSALDAAAAGGGALRSAPRSAAGPTVRARAERMGVEAAARGDRVTIRFAGARSWSEPELRVALAAFLRELDG
ncbi:ParB/RepB/Spo0J family partition protein [Rubrimonas cliftonensis]|uniref:Chromosome partitioning protein, ParB family n=1 Tax=Rubrimonas cliftonensis TaxID=89524 RepID=A0A1H4CWQ7_9RHOB|nr:ParB N-terminal domain-containing protein [Rubrimonas cliftonensis]SEA64794.1 chromosome partitioning protein, ParB family [Rubrimonas cliftonensis]